MASSEPTIRPGPTPDTASSIESVTSLLELCRNNVMASLLIKDRGADLTDEEANIVDESCLLIYTIELYSAGVDLDVVYASMERPHKWAMMNTAEGLSVTALFDDEEADIVVEGAPPPPRPMQCKVCDAPLTGTVEYVPADEGRTYAIRYEHGGRQVGHAPIPVPIDENMAGFCDLCGVAAPKWMVTCLPNTYTGTTGTLHTHDTGQWAACDACAELVVDNRWDELTTRCLDEIARANRLTDLDPEGVTAVRAMHANLRDTFQGIAVIGSAS